MLRVRGIVWNGTRWWHPAPLHVTCASDGGCAASGAARWHETQSLSGVWWSAWQLEQSRSPGTASASPRVWQRAQAIPACAGCGKVSARAGSVVPTEKLTGRTARKDPGEPDPSWQLSHEAESGGRWWQTRQSSTVLTERLP